MPSISEITHRYPSIRNVNLKYPVISIASGHDNGTAVPTEIYKYLARTNILIIIRVRGINDIQFDIYLKTCTDERYIIYTTSNAINVLEILM